MWLVNLLTNEEGWHIPQIYQKEPSPLLVFIKDGNIWKTKLWTSTETRIRAKNRAEETKDDYDMIQSGFTLGFTRNHFNINK
jgi:hypothetical protein